jgi:tetratricopeptide (TPR) repeat protein
VLGYENGIKRAPEIARELGVDALVEGSVQRVGNRVRVNAQLVFAPRETHLWAQSYDRDLVDALAVQSTLAEAIAEQVKVKLTPGQQARSQAQRPVNLNALEAYFQGDYHLAKVGQRLGNDEDSSAIAYFQQAIRDDPNFAAAYVKICDVYEVQAVITSQADRWPKEKAAAEKAVFLDPSLPGAHLALGYVRLLYDWDFPAARAEFLRAVELDPNNAIAHDALGDFLEITNHPDEGLREHVRAQELDPGRDHLSNSYYRERKYDRVIELAKKQIELHPDDGVAHWGLFHNYAQIGMERESIEHFVQTANLFGYNDAALAVRHAYVTSGSRAAMQEAAKQMARYYTQGQFDRPVQVAIGYGRLGDKDQALRWLQKAVSSRDAEVVFLNCEPAFDFLRADEQFQDLIRRVGLPQ